MDGSLRIGRLFGIPILLHYTFLLVIPLFAYIIGSQIGATTDMLKEIFNVGIDSSLITAGYMPWILGTIVALGLFFGVLVHELAHSLVARSKGIKMQSITLLMFGGVAQMDEGAPEPRTELPMALAGPIMSLIFGLVCCGLVYVTPEMTTDPATAGSSYLHLRVSRRAQHHPLCVQPDPRLSHGRRPGAQGDACDTDAASPCDTDRGKRW